MSGPQGNRLIKQFKKSFDHALGTIAKNSFSKQLLIGVTSGWCTGMVVGNVGKTAAFTLGCGIILYAIANHKGYLNVDWGRMKEQAEKKGAEYSKKYAGNGPKLITTVKTFAIKNRIFTTGFVGGFFIGIGF